MVRWLVAVLREGLPVFIRVRQSEHADDAVQRLINRIEATINRIEATINRIETTINRFEALVHLRLQGVERPGDHRALKA